jgi:hypothetical protein
MCLWTNTTEKRKIERQALKTGRNKLGDFTDAIIRGAPEMPQREMWNNTLLVEMAKIPKPFQGAADNEQSILGWGMDYN